MKREKSLKEKFEFKLQQELTSMNMRYDLEKQELETEKNIYKDNATEY